MKSREQQIFKKGSTTYYFSSKFFPKAVREDVFRLYSFVRVADDYVDEKPQQAKLFMELREGWLQAITNHNFNTTPAHDDTINTRVIKNMVHVSKRYDFEPAWVDAFLDAMESDVKGRTFHTLPDSLGYVSGSAEMIGLMMARIMGVPDEALPYARMQGRAMQWLNFIRDIDEDNKLGRQYFPQSDLEKYDLPNLLPGTAKKYPERFASFMHFQIDRYYAWQQEAAQGFHYIPRRLRVPLQIANDMYSWTAEQIEKESLIVFEHKVKPQKILIIKRGLAQILTHQYLH